MSAPPDSTRRTCAVILAAGGSTRLGRPKQLEPWGEETLLERAVRLARSAGCVPVVVLGHAAEEIEARCDLSCCEVVFNPAWQQGMATSVQMGIESAARLGAEAAVVMTCDQPAVSVEHLLHLMERSQGVKIVASSYAGRNGVPALFPAADFSVLQALRGDTGARRLLQDVQTVPLLFGEMDVDNEEALRRARDVLMGKSGG